MWMAGVAHHGIVGCYRWTSEPLPLHQRSTDARKHHRHSGSECGLCLYIRGGPKRAAWGHGGCVALLVPAHSCIFQNLDHGDRQGRTVQMYSTVQGMHFENVAKWPSIPFFAVARHRCRSCGHCARARELLVLMQRKQEEYNGKAQCVCSWYAAWQERSSFVPALPTCLFLLPSLSPFKTSPSSPSSLCVPFMAFTPSPPSPTDSHDDHSA